MKQYIDRQLPKTCTIWFGSELS